MRIAWEFLKFRIGLLASLKKKKRISYSDRFIRLLGQEKAIGLVYMKFQKYLVKFCKSLRFLLPLILQDSHTNLTSSRKSSVIPGGEGVVYYY